ncbi:hypothetical protein DFQ27_002671 [Actinomortierella ambigua]|uniref:Uncharacterized protein n=1 Tax=Actinomortierella ambigua TaxID=1343610 RepID=A0A9P6QAC6_9FUNG|nr:hypothetical protein DFQ27_002671 [Actinomortierella ambigua]
MKFTSIITFFALSAAAVSAMPVAEDTPAQLYRRAPCDSDGKAVDAKLVQTYDVFWEIDHLYFASTKTNPELSQVIIRAGNTLDVIFNEIRDELADPVSQRSAGPVLNNARTQFQQDTQQIKTGLERAGLVNAGSRMAPMLKEFVALSTGVEADIKNLVSCWKKAGGP